MNNSHPRYVTRSAVEGLVEKMKLPAPGEFTQDWEYEVADSTRIGEFLHAYENMDLNLEEKFALMIIIVESYNDAILGNKVEENMAELIKYHLIRDINIHINTIYYWAKLDEDDIENVFAITPFMRELAAIDKKM
ncbi:hypothetical protein SAMN04487969_11480 [Paenibacillus algorifonticola]|uniref:Uncharacterized protein n=1 Tax=Paenibacillus algorifonticola TaxID=684063 RepID=A0A1I2G179_9BACL|nr:hypothetical protein [Paenibacillus algorifonticola]SFF11302.1 hypothetical protein SAMN04487969_11480 [Paenibacillus algorifonticola]